MPRFFFNIHDGIERLDWRGAEFCTLAAARSGAIEAVNLIMKGGWGRSSDTGLTMNVVDQAGHCVLRIKAVAGYYP